MGRACWIKINISEEIIPLFETKRTSECLYPNKTSLLSSLCTVYLVIWVSTMVSIINIQTQIGIIQQEMPEMGYWVICLPWTTYFNTYTSYFVLPCLLWHAFPQQDNPWQIWPKHSWLYMFQPSYQRSPKLQIHSSVSCETLSQIQDPGKETYFQRICRFSN